MSYIKKFFHSLSAKEVRVLGRWTLETCVSKINSKVDYANEDHCGVCSSSTSKDYASNKIIIVKLHINSEEDDNIDEYIRYMM